ncbi:MAG: hypothetical protein ACR2MT_13950 [Aurantibacter sp.]
MENLNAEQVKKLADDLLQMANALGDYRYKHFKNLSSEENLKLKDLHSRTLSRTTELYTKAAVLVMDDVTVSLNKIEIITAQTVALYEKLTNVQKVLDRATSIVTMASSIISLDVKGIASSLKGLLS